MTKLDDMTSVELSNWVKKRPEIERLRAALVQVRGFAAVMDESNWRDCKLYIERQCNALSDEQEVKK